MRAYEHLGDRLPAIRSGPQGAVLGARAASSGLDVSGRGQGGRWRGLGRPVAAAVGAGRREPREARGVRRSYVAGSALLLTSALVAVPGFLLGLAVPPRVRSRVRLVTASAWSLASLRRSFVGPALSPGDPALPTPRTGSATASRCVTRTRRRRPARGRPFTDMALAAGLAGAARSWCSRRPRRRERIRARYNALEATDRGHPRLPDLLSSPDEQRAVVAVLVARVIAGDILFGTALAALMGPLNAVRESPGAREQGVRGRGRHRHGPAGGAGGDTGSSRRRPRRGGWRLRRRCGAVDSATGPLRSASPSARRWCRITYVAVLGSRGS